MIWLSRMVGTDAPARSNENDTAGAGVRTAAPRLPRPDRASAAAPSAPATATAERRRHPSAAPRRGALGIGRRDRAQPLGEGRGGGQPLGRRPRHRRRHQPRDRRRHPREIVAPRRPAEIVGAGQRRWLVRGHQLVQQQPQRPDVGARVLQVAAALLGRHVARRAAAGSRPGLAVAGADLVERRQPEIEHGHPAALADEDVVRLEVAVQHALGVGVRDGVGDLDHDRQRVAEIHRPPRERAEVGAAQQFEHCGTACRRARRSGTA
jgi:hypothetical protein